MALIGVAGTSAGVALAIVRERIDRKADARAMKKASEEQKPPVPEADSDEPPDNVPGDKA